MRTLITKWRRLSRERRALLVRALFLVAAVRLGLLVLPYRVVRRLLQLAHRRAVPLRDVSAGRDVTWAVRRAARVVPSETCLTRALVVETLLARRGHRPSIQIGVRRAEGGALEAHAWVEVDGHVVAGGGAFRRFVPLRSALGGRGLSAQRSDSDPGNVERPRPAGSTGNASFTSRAVMSRKTYATPQLTVYGGIAQLTQCARSGAAARPGARRSAEGPAQVGGTADES
jgi:hypothetical protein